MSVPEDVSKEIMCTCTGTTRGQIYDLCQQGKDLEGISRHTGILTGCGGCEWDIGQFVNALKELKQASNDKLGD